MKQKKSNVQRNASAKEASFNIDNQEDERIFEEEELKDTIGIGKYKTYYFIAHLKIFYLSGFANKNINNLTDLAWYLHREKKLYTTLHGKYKLMKFSSILDNLHALSKEVKEEIEHEKKMKDKYKCKK